jgi:hypothetical protein
MSPQRSPLTISLATVGVVLAWFPFVATLATSLVGSLRTGWFVMDYLMPAELFPAVLVGGALLLWAAVRARNAVAATASSLAVAAASLVLAQLVAVTTGVASGAAPPEGLRLWVVVAGLVTYTFAALALALAGTSLLVTIARPFSGRRSPGPGAA